MSACIRIVMYDANGYPSPIPPTIDEIAAIFSETAPVELMLAAAGALRAGCLRILRRRRP